jgi:hypothetical protein
MLSKKIKRNSRKNKINKLGVFLNEWGGFFNEGFFVEKIKKVCGIEKCCTFVA